MGLGEMIIQHFSEHDSVAYQINRNEMQNTLFAEYLL